MSSKPTANDPNNDTLLVHPFDLEARMLDSCVILRCYAEVLCGGRGCSVVGASPPGQGMIMTAIGQRRLRSNPHWTRSHQPANGTCCREWGCSHWMQATPRKLAANMRARVHCGLGLGNKRVLYASRVRTWLSIPKSWMSLMNRVGDQPCAPSSNKPTTQNNASITFRERIS